MSDPRDDNQDARVIELTVAPSEAGLRLDAFLVEHCPDLTRNRIQGDVKQGRVLVQGRSRPKGFKLKAGWSVEYRPSEIQPMTAVPQDLPLEIVYQDDDLLILNKAAGMVVHPSPGHPDGTVVNALLHHVQGLEAGDNPLRPGIVHRLDRDTTGLMAVALNHQSHAHLADQLKDRRMGRTYQAISWGSWKTDQGTLAGDIGRHPRQRQKMAIVPQQGRSATTHYLVLEDHGFVQLCQVKLETGRTHQIRVHFAENHHPVVGDPLYGDDGRAKAVHPLDRSRAARMVSLADRQMLHACRLQLEHPASGEPLDFEISLPLDMAQVLAVLHE